MTPPADSNDSGDNDSRSEHKRGDKGAYQRYLDGMDSSMRQKVALVAAHLRSHGKVADMGMGSGTGSYTLAALYPSLDVVGVDLDPTMVEMASQRYNLENLEFVVGDIAKEVFTEGTLDAVINSSVLHHVTSFTGYSYAEAGKAIAVQVRALKDGGIILVRDFLASEAGDVLLDLPCDDGDSSDDPESCSTSCLFEKFADDFRSLSDSPGFVYDKLHDAAAGPPLLVNRSRYRLPLRFANEFVLRKDYRRDYQKEAKEEYCYYTQREFENVLGSLGLRVLVSIPLYNPWIVNNRYKGKFSLWDEHGSAIDFPATNYIIAGEKVAQGQGVRMSEGQAKPRLNFLRLEYYRHRTSGRVFDLVRRPNRTLDVLPWFESNGDLFVVARSSYPRPILRASCRVNAANASLDGASAAGYITEPISVIQGDSPIGTTICEILSAAGISDDAIAHIDTGSSYYPSPGGLEEEVTSVLVRISDAFEPRATDNQTGFTSAGRVVAMEAQQLLRSAQVGGLLDARLEMNAYELLLQRGRRVGPWIGESISLENGSDLLPKSEVGTILSRDHRRCFVRSCAQESAGFLEVHCAEFEELDASGEVLQQVTLEYVRASSLSHNTISVAILGRDGDEIMIGVDDADLPAAQSFTGNSELLVAPAWRIPKEICSLEPAMAWVTSQLELECGIVTASMSVLGGRYHPSLGATPEVVHAIAIEIGEIRSAERPLLWLNLKELITSRKRIRDGHLRIVALRAAHALGLLQE